MKILVAIDSLKGCLDSWQAGRAAAEGVHDVLPGCEVCCLPVSDGGEGMLEMLRRAGLMRKTTACVHGPLMERLEAAYGLSLDGQTAFIEMAAACGLPLVPEDRRNPMLTTTYGLGELMADAVLRHGCRRLFIGLGGSATNDAGLDMLQALGCRFTDERGETLAQGGRALNCLADADVSGLLPELRSCEVVAACDVRNPLYGPQGAAHVFAPQKGADARMVGLLDAGLRRFASVTGRVTGCDVAFLPGAGAAGGVGAALAAYLHASLEPGVSLLFRMLDFDARLEDAGLVITGEGRADRQTLMGKVPGGILEAASRRHVPVVLIAGQVDDGAVLLQAGFRGVYDINPPDVSLARAMCPPYAAGRIRATVAKVVREFLRDTGAAGVQDV